MFGRSFYLPWPNSSHYKIFDAHPTVSEHLLPTVTQHLTQSPNCGPNLPELVPRCFFISLFCLFFPRVLQSQHRRRRTDSLPSVP